MELYTPFGLSHIAAVLTVGVLALVLGAALLELIEELIATRRRARRR